MTFKKIGVSGVAIAAVAFLSTSALAGNNKELTEDGIVESSAIAVDYSDLKLESPKGQEILFHRLSRAAEQACGPQTYREAGSISIASRNKACYEDAMSRALSQISASAVAQRD
ncbi:MAG: UrcA family protein [Pseudomonadota bacterium]